MEILFESIQWLAQSPDGWKYIVMWLIGGLLIFLAICRPARESMERKLFI